MNLREMSADEIICKVDTGEIKSEQYGSFTEYVIGMEQK